VDKRNEKYQKCFDSCFESSLFKGISE